MEKMSPARRIAPQSSRWKAKWCSLAFGPLITARSCGESPHVIHVPITSGCSMLSTTRSANPHAPNSRSHRCTYGRAPNPANRSRAEDVDDGLATRALQEADNERLVDASQVPIEVIPAAPHGDKSNPNVALFPGFSPSGIARSSIAAASHATYDRSGM
jgi:hypothetical protein